VTDKTGSYRYPRAFPVAPKRAWSHQSRFFSLCHQPNPIYFS